MSGLGCPRRHLVYACAALGLVACGRIDFDPASDCGPLEQQGVPYANSPGADGASTGTAFVVCTEAQLVAIGQHPEHWASFFRLGSDIDLTAPWQPIGTDLMPVSVSFDGGGHAIGHLAIDLPTQDGVGMFASLGHGARFANLALTDVDVGGGKNTGSLAGAADGLEIDHVTIDGRVRGDRAVGGVIGLITCDGCQRILATTVGATLDLTATGQNNGGVFGIVEGPTAEGLAHLDSLTSAGTVSSGTTVGGVLGYGAAIDLTRSSSSAHVTTSSGNAGGLVGETNDETSIISLSSASGEVTCPTGLCGGLVSYLEGTLTTSHASGSITVCAGTCGGLVADLNGNISRSYATGDVIASVNSAGGLVGEGGGEISDCYATGRVTAPMAFAGGLVGIVSGNITRSYSTAAVTGGDEIGGFAGRAQTPTMLTDSFATGDVAGASAVNHVSRFLGADLSTIKSGVFFSVAATCTNSTGACTDVGTQVPNASYFFAATNEPLSRWDFNSVWQEAPGGFPQLR